MAVYFSKAFDTVNHTNLLSDILNTNMEHNIVRWLTTYYGFALPSADTTNSSSPTSSTSVSHKAQCSLQS